MFRPAFLSELQNTALDCGHPRIPRLDGDQTLQNVPCFSALICKFSQAGNFTKITHDLDKKKESHLGNIQKGRGCRSLFLESHFITSNKPT